MEKHCNKHHHDHDVQELKRRLMTLIILFLKAVKVVCFITTDQYDWDLHASWVLLVNFLVLFHIGI